MTAVPIAIPPAGWALLGVLAGLIAGSFLSTLALRWGHGGTIAGRSRCDACGRTLAVRDLVPLLSWAALGGRCRTCRAPIDRRHPIVELLAGLIGALALGLAPGWAGVAGALFGWALLLLALLDLDHFWLPDRVTLPLMAAGLGAALLGLGPRPNDALIGAAAGWLVLAGIAALYRRARGRSGLGGGDPKLLAAIGAWLGWTALPIVLLGASVAGLLLIAGLALAGRKVSATTRVPFGALLAPAGFAMWLWIAGR